MMVPWMVYALAAALLLGLAARALEAVVRQCGRPIRWLWLAALAGSVALPLLAAFVLPPPPPPSPAATLAAESSSSIAAPAAGPVAPAPSPALAAMEIDPDPLLGAGWGIASLALAGCLVTAHGRLLRRKRAWSLRTFDDREVWVSPDTGPAVIGLVRSFIVVPEWVLEREAGEVEMVLAHEAEHLRAGDPRLLLGAMLLLVACPWNPALWWQWRRLRQAVEVDCDLRVLARGADRQRYSRLLVAVAERGSAHRLVLASLAESRSLLERRIQVMVEPPTRGWLPRASLAAVAAIALTTAACRMDRPSAALTAGPGEALTAEAAGEMAVADLPPGWKPPVPVPSQRTNHAAVRLAIQTTYPEVLTGEAEGARHYIVFITNTRGEIERSHLQTNAAYPIGSDMEDLQEWFPGTDWYEARKSWQGTMEIYHPPHMGVDTVIVTYMERRVEGEPTGPFLLYRGPRRGSTTSSAAVVPAAMEIPATSPVRQAAQRQDSVTFQITSEVPGRKVRVRVSGPAAEVRIEGPSMTRNDDGTTTATTPLTVQITSGAPVTMHISGSQLELSTVTGREETRVRANSLSLTRRGQGEPVLIIVGETPNLLRVPPLILPEEPMPAVVPLQIPVSPSP